LTFLEMQTDALDLLQEVQAHGQYSATKLKHYLNQGNLAFARKTKCIEVTVDITTVAEQFEYDSSDAAGLITLMIPYQFRYVDGTEMGEPLKPYPGGYTNLPKVYSYGKPFYYWIRNIHAATVAAPSAYVGVRVGTWPICDTADKTLRIDGFMRPTVLSADAHISEIQPEWHDAVVYYAVSRIFSMFAHLQPEWGRKATFYLSEFERMVAEANEFMIIQNDEPMELPDVYYEMDQ